MSARPATKSARRRSGQPDVAASSKRLPRVIYVAGIDGSGKSAVTNHLATLLREHGRDVEILWLRFNNVLSKPLLGLCRMLGYTRYESVDGIRVGYHSFWRSRPISVAFILLQYLDAARVRYTRILPRLLFTKKVLILDRYVYDILIDLAVDTGRPDIIESWIGRRFAALLPHGTRTLLIIRKLEDVLLVRPEGRVDGNFEARYRLFNSLADGGSLEVIANSGTLDELLESFSKATGLYYEN